jgi:hypothetical protein
VTDRVKFSITECNVLVMIIGGVWGRKLEMQLETRAVRMVMVSNHNHCV